MGAPWLESRHQDRCHPGSIMARVLIPGDIIQGALWLESWHQDRHHPGKLLWGLVKPTGLFHVALGLRMHEFSWNVSKLFCGFLLILKGAVPGKCPEVKREGDAWLQVTRRSEDNYFYFSQAVCKFEDRNITWWTVSATRSTEILKENEVNE